MDKHELSRAHSDTYLQPAGEQDHKFGTAGWRGEDEARVWPR